MSIIKLFIYANVLLTSLSTAECFLAPYNHWHCIDLVKNIDKTKPYAFNVGELPLVSWFNKSETDIANSVVTTVNICKHAGSRLDNGKILDDGCMACPYHGLKIGKNDAFGKTMIYQDKLWWAYEPKQTKPPSIPYYNNKKFATTSFTLFMDANFRDCIFNTFDIHHFAHVHSNILGTLEPPKNYNFKVLSDDKLMVSYKYKTNKNIAKIKSNLDVFNNIQIFQYPYTSSSILSLSSNNEKLVVDVNMLPVSQNRTKWIITLKHNFWTSYFDRLKVDLVLKYILSQDQYQMSKQFEEGSLKQKMMNKVMFRNEDHFRYLNKIYKNYKYPDMYSAMQLYEYHKQKSG